DEGLEGAREVLAVVAPASQWISDPAGTLRVIRETLAAEELDGYWLHIDVDVLDPSIMPAVDSPDPGGLDRGQLTALLSELADEAIGADVCIFDPDLDPDGEYAELVADTIADALGGLGGLGLSSDAGSRGIV
ncbi:arginase family protein, partial [Actinomadura sp. NPDC048955]|uniref:arginase family protein n=1 Tax=Actinomadura sp. NPDC048955 TaxID=3158228 RepID=UPI0033FF9FA5